MATHLPIGTLVSRVRTETAVNSRVISAAVLGGVFFLSACGGGTSSSSASSAADIQLTTEAPAEEMVAEDAADLPDASLAGVDEMWEVLIVETDEALDVVREECALGEGPTQPNADFSNRVFTGPDLRCADLTGASFVNATLLGVDLSGAVLAGADFTGATLDITAHGADFTRAVFNGADLRSSDLRGSSFASADLTGSTFTDLPVGMALTDLTGATFGCNVFYGSAGMSMAGVVLSDSCQSGAQFSRATLRGSYYGAAMPGFDFAATAVESVDFRRVDLTGSSFADYGILPEGIDFSGSLMNQADLTGVGLFGASFVGSDLSFAKLVGSFSVSGDFTVAIFDSTDMTGMSSERNAYVGAQFTNTTMSNVELLYDDMTDATLTGVVADGLVMDTVKCPGAASGERYGLCTVGAEVAF